jgi:hypothetical protein
MSWDETRRELITMAETDLRVRTELASDGRLFDGYHPQMQAVHDANAKRLAVVLDAHGWPGESRVGRDGNEAAWLIVQHAIAQPALQRRALAALALAVERGESPARHAAMLDDRIRCFEGRPQRYGTQFDWDESGEMSPLPLADPARVDELRQSVGLPPLADDIRGRRQALAQGSERRPDDWKTRQQEMEAWCRRVGWR